MYERSGQNNNFLEKDGAKGVVPWEKQVKQIWCKKRGESPTGTLCTLGFEINMTPMYQVCESYMNKVDS